MSPLDGRSVRRLHSFKQHSSCVRNIKQHLTSNHDIDGSRGELMVTAVRYNIAWSDGDKTPASSLWLALTLHVMNKTVGLGLEYHSVWPRGYKYILCIELVTVMEKEQSGAWW